MRNFLIITFLFLFLTEIAAEENKSLIIVTTDTIRDGSKKISEFINEKEKRGFRVLLVSERDFGGKDKKGYEKAVIIRKWLKNNRSDYKFLLLIGDPNTKVGNIPMVQVMPGGPDVADPCISTGYSCTKIPTDYYYADLSGEFDLNEDGIPGQYPQDLEPGGVDFEAELYTGRIPVYFEDYDELDSVLTNIINYMQMENSEIDYRNKILFPMSFIWFDGYKVFQTMHENEETAEVSEWFIFNVLSKYKNISYTKLYEAEGFYPSRYQFDSPLNNENIIEEWKKGYGMVFWGGHGYPGSVSRTVWLEDKNSNNLSENDEVASYVMISSSDGKKIASGRPSFVVAISCLVGNVDAPGSVSHRFLADGAALGIISSSSVTDPSKTIWHDMNSELDKNSVSEDTAGIYFFEGLINGRFAGEVFYEYKKNYGSEAKGRVLDHKYMLNYFGDPTLTLYDSAIDENNENSDTDEQENDENEVETGGCSFIFL